MAAGVTADSVSRLDDCESMTPAEGSASRPSARRNCSRFSELTPPAVGNLLVCRIRARTLKGVELRGVRAGLVGTPDERAGSRAGSPDVAVTDL